MILLLSVFTGEGYNRVDIVLYRQYSDDFVSFHITSNSVVYKSSCKVYFASTPPIL